MEPYHIILLGIIIVVLGVGWAFYVGPRRAPADVVTLRNSLSDANATIGKNQKTIAELNDKVQRLETELQSRPAVEQTIDNNAALRIERAWQLHQAIEKLSGLKERLVNGGNRRLNILKISMTTDQRLPWHWELDWTTVADMITQTSQIVYPSRQLDLKTQPSPDFQYKSAPGDAEIPEDKRNEYRRQAVYQDKDN